jgi:hypothetical protein
MLNCPELCELGAAQPAVQPYAVRLVSSTAAPVTLLAAALLLLLAAALAAKPGAAQPNATQLAAMPHLAERLAAQLAVRQACSSFVTLMFAEVAALPAALLDAPLPVSLAAYL